MIAVTFALVEFSAISVRIFNPTLLEKYKAMGAQNVTKIIGVGQVCDLVGIIIGAFLTECVGRKPLVILGFFGAGIGTFAIPFTKNAVLLAAAIGLQQLAQAWIFQVMMVRVSFAFVT